jgi:UDP-N-acetylmuramate--alanine ligase
MSEISLIDLQSLLASGSRNIHLVGVAGSGMSGLARLLAQRGHQVTGSDLDEESYVAEFEKRGIKLFHGHSADHILSPDFVCYSSAIPTDNAELLEAQRRGIPLVRRARALSALVSPQSPLVISGMHGKTTTTSMVAWILKSAKKNPSFFVGSTVPILSTNAEIGSGKEFVIEADESDGTMREFVPEDLVILNIEPEHLDFYENLDAIERAFENFASTVKGRIIYCADNEISRRLGSRFKNGISYSIEAKSSKGWSAVDIRRGENETSFDVTRDGVSMGNVKLSVPGRHNVSNALAALALTLDRGVQISQASAALKEFQGARRRFEHLFENKEFLIVDDYAHHPTEIAATIEAAKQKGRKRLTSVFQPHRYTRTKAFYSEFGSAFKDADRVFITDIYAASETPIEGITGKLIADSAIENNPETKKVTYEPNLWKLKEAVGSQIEEGDLTLIMGAGNISQISKLLAEELKVFCDIQKLVSPDTVVKRYEPMSKRTSMRTGGSAKLWVEPVNEQELAAILKYCSDQRKTAKANSMDDRCARVTFVGRGSNLLVRDAGISGVTIHLGVGEFTKIEIQEDKIVAGSGAKLKQIVMAARRANLTGLEFMEGIPGSLGGGLWMNAGAMGGSIFNVVERVRVMDMEGNIFEKVPSELDVHYRSCKGLKGFVVLSGVLNAQPGKREEINALLKEYEKKRWSSQPAASSAGCIFKNPQPASAGKIIDELGLKGLSFGRACISDVHGNFIVNSGGATASEVLSLISMVKERVRNERGIELETEVVVIGDDRW